MINKIKIGNVEINSKVSLAPMAGITDVVFRGLVRNYSKNCLITTEMLSSEALAQRPYGNILETRENEFPLAFQISGHKPLLMAKAAKIVEEKADIIDINMGCPVNKVVKGGDGSHLMRTPKLAADIVKSVCDSVDRPVTVKFRLGYTNAEKNFVEFGKLMEEAGAKAITIHARTRAQMYSGEADWSEISKLKKEVSIPIFANGDINTLDDAIECLKITGADGVAIARGAMGNPLIFEKIDKYFETGEILKDLTLSQKIDILKQHLEEEMELRGIENGIKFMRKFYSYYIHAVKNACGIRGLLVVEEDYKKIFKVLEELKTYE